VYYFCESSVIGKWRKFIMRSFIICTLHQILLSGGVSWAGQEEKRDRSWDLVWKPEEDLDVDRW
jgi:hypothetical protein